MPLITVDSQKMVTKNAINLIKFRALSFLLAFGTLRAVAQIQSSRPNSFKYKGRYPKGKRPLC